MVEEVNEVQGGEREELRSLIREVIEEYLASERTRSEPAYKAELLEERKRREQLEKRLNELIAENEKARRAAEEAERTAAIKEELRKLGVVKVDLAFRAVKDDIYRTEDGRLVARSAEGELPMRDYLIRFVKENPELLPARVPGGSGASAANEWVGVKSLDLSRIRPGMDPEELNAIRKEVAEVVARTLSGG